MGRRRHRTTNSTAAFGLAAVAVLGPQLLGGATELTALLVHALAALACCSVAFGLRHSGRLGVVPWAAVGSLGAAVWTLCQAVPLPCTWTSWAQPERFELMQQIAELSDSKPLYCSISAAPGATWASFAMATSLTALLLAATAVGRAGSQSILLRSVALSSVLMAFVALVHWVLNASEVFGVYEPVYVKPRLLLAPLMNENHLAGHMALGWPVCLGLAVSSRHVERKVVWGASAGIVFVTGLMSLSRGGAVALVLGGALFVFLHRVRRGQRSGMSAAPVLLLMLCGAAGSYFAYDLLGSEFRSQEAPFDKLAIAADLARLAVEHPWVGWGRGALADVSAAVLLRNQRAMWVENLPLQWLVEWGAPFAAALLASLAISVRNTGIRRLRDTELGVLCGLAALGAQNLVDFSLELPGLASTAAIAFGSYLAREGQTTASPSMRVDALLKWSSGACVLSLALAFPWLTAWSRTELRQQLEHTEAHDSESAKQTLQRAFAGYPVEPAFVVLGASAAVHRNDASAARWLNLAMRVAPGWAGPHLIAAEFLERLGAFDQAAIELSLATGIERGAAAGRACLFVSRHPRADLAWSAADQEPSRRQRSLEELSTCVSALEEREALAARILDAYPQSLSSASTLVAVAQQRHQPELALARARQLRAAHPSSEEAYVQLGRVLLANNEPGEVLTLLDEAPAELRSDKDMLNLELAAVARTGPRDRFAATLERLLVLYGRNADERAGIHKTASNMLAAGGDAVGALAHAQSAYDLTSAPADLEFVHRSALRAGLVAVALRTASELCQVRYHPEVYCRTGRGTASP